MNKLPHNWYVSIIKTLDLFGEGEMGMLEKGKLLDGPLQCKADA